MRRAMIPRLQVLVCVNRREEGSPLGPGCGAFGERVADPLKQHVLSLGLAREVWITRTHCLGLCPEVGTAVALYPKHRIYTEVLVEDLPTLLAELG